MIDEDTKKLYHDFENEDDDAIQYLMCIFNGLNINLTKKLQEYFNPSNDGSTYRESFITLLVTLIGDGNLLNIYLDQFNGMYETTDNNSDEMPEECKYKDVCLWSGVTGQHGTHYYSCFPKNPNDVYDAYEKYHQWPYSHYFCQIFSLYNIVNHKLPPNMRNQMIEYDYVNNAFKALKFMSYILHLDYLEDSFNKSLRIMYKEQNNPYDLKNYMDLSEIRYIIKMFNRIDMFPTILHVIDDMPADEDIIKQFIIVDSKNTRKGNVCIQKCVKRVSQYIGWGFDKRKSVRKSRRRKSVRKSRKRKSTRRKSVRKSRRRKSVRKSVRKSRRRKSVRKSVRKSRRRKSVRKSRRRKSVRKSRRRKSVRKSVRKSRSRKSVRKSRSRKSVRKSRSRKSVRKSRSRKSIV
jgi:hypothetical protein